MLINEAEWISLQLEKFSKKDISPMINLGSGDNYFRTKQQPWVKEMVFLPLAKKGIKVYHFDKKASQGVDIVGEVESDITESKIGFNPKAIIATNIFEHIKDKNRLAKDIKNILPKGGIIICSAPYHYPYHPSTIDTGYRPTPKELSKLFGDGVELIAHKTIKDETYLHYLKLNKFHTTLSFIRLFVPFYRPVNWWSHVMHLPWLNKNFECSCIILRKT